MVPRVQVRAEERELGGPVLVITMSFWIPVLIPIRETVGLDLVQETLLVAPHLVRVFPDRNK